MARRVAASMRAREPISELIEGGLSSADGRAALVKLATRLIVEEALEAESRAALGRAYYEHGASAGQGCLAHRMRNLAAKVPVFGAMIRAAERWRAIGVGELERRQMRAAREELDQEYEAANGLVVVGQPCISVWSGMVPRRRRRRRWTSRCGSRSGSASRVLCWWARA